MQNPQWQERSADNLTGSPELFASNLLLVRAMDQQLNKIEIRRHNDAIGVLLYSSDREYDEETLTEQTEKWSPIVERFESLTNFNNDREGILEPSIPVQDPVEKMTIRYDQNEIIISFHYN